LPQAWKLVACFDAVELIPEDRDANSYEQQRANEKFDTAGAPEEMRRGILSPVMMPFHGNHPLLVFQASFE
jgi:hypothetical protein